MVEEHSSAHQTSGSKKSKSNFLRLYSDFLAIVPAVAEEDSIPAITNEQAAPGPITGVRSSALIPADVFR